MPEAKPYAISKQVVWEAYQKVKANHGAAGVDGQSIEAFETDLKGNLYKIWNRMSSGSYFPPPVRLVEIPKASGGSRPLGIPTVGDRVAQMVVKMHLEPLVEPHFHPDSYGYRPGRSALDAVATARERCWRSDWVIEYYFLLCLARLNSPNRSCIIEFHDRFIRVQGTIMERRYELRLGGDVGSGRGLARDDAGAPRRGSKHSSSRSQRRSTEPEQRRHAAEYMTGLLSDLERKTGEAIAYLHDQERQGLQKFVGQCPGTTSRCSPSWPARSARSWASPTPCIVFDPSALRQEGDQVGRRAAAVVRPARQGRQLPGRRLHGLRLAEGARPGRYPALPAQGVGEGPGPPEGGGRAQGRSGSAPGTSWPWRCSTSAARLLPHGWVAGDDEMGRPSWFRRELRARGERYLLARAVEHAGPRPRRAAAGILGTRATSQGPVRAAGSLAGGPAGGRLDPDRGA